MSLSERTLRRNIAANYAGQLYVGFVGILTVPAYLEFMSPEAYGLIGFFALLQAWAQLLDFGLSATVTREAARFGAKPGGAADFRNLLRSFGWLFWSMGLLLALAMIVLSPRISGAWLDVRQLQPAEVQASVRLMGVAIALRWVAGLYRGVISGIERQVWLNGFNMVVASLRFLAPLPVMLAVGATPVAFFGFQALVSAVEVGWLMRMAYRHVPAAPRDAARAPWSSIRPALRFAAGMGVATVVWVLVTQSDKLLLSAALPLAEYGFFTAAVAAASAISLLSVATSQALLPRLTRLAEAGDDPGFFALYRTSTQWTVVAGVPLTLSLAVFASPLLWIWTANADFANRYASVLALYAIGNGFAALAALPYYLQYARGQLQLHVWGNVAFACVLVPAVVHAARVHGAIGTAWTWAISNVLFFLLWSPLVHRRFAPGLQARWLLRDVLKTALVPIAIASLAAGSLPWHGSRIEIAMGIALCALAMTASAAALSDWGMARLRILYRRHAPGLRSKR